MSLKPEIEEQKKKYSSITCFFLSEFQLNFSFILTFIPFLSYFQRVVYLKDLPSGLLLVTGMYMYE